MRRQCILSITLSHPVRRAGSPLSLRSLGISLGIERTRCRGMRTAIHARASHTTMNTPSLSVRSVGIRNRRRLHPQPTPATSMRNLYDLFLNEMMHLNVCIHGLRERIPQISGNAACWRLRPVFNAIDAIARTHLFSLDRALLEHDVVPTEHTSPALTGMLDEAQDYAHRSAHASVGGAGVIGAMRRLTRYMEGLCMASAESALLLGFDDIRRDLGVWAAAWRGLERQLQSAAVESNAAAFLAN